ncbi:MAG: phosphotransferase, partial [Solirubrobacterales bacterium]
MALRQPVDRLVRGLGELADHLAELLEALLGLAVAAGGVARVDALEDHRQLPPAERDEEVDLREIAAVVDWELCTLGDPLADVGMLIVYWGAPGDQLVPLIEPPTAIPGFPP